MSFAVAILLRLLLLAGTGLPWLAGQILGVTYLNDPASLRDEGYTYDRISNRTLVIYGRTARTLRSTYDPLNRLARCEERDSAGTVSDRSTTHAYNWSHTNSCWKGRSVQSLRRWTWYSS